MLSRGSEPSPPHAEVPAAIRALPEIHRDVLVAEYVAGLTYTEIKEEIPELQAD